MCLSLLRFLPGRRKECIYHQHIIVRALLPWIARETQGWAINKCDYIPGIAAFFARETQDFASLQG